ncbi:MAG: glycosyltransferase family 4 protein [Conexivisphaerales archaeon]
MKSILFLTYHYPPEVGGIQTRISKYVETMIRLGCSVTVAVVRPRQSVIRQEVSNGAETVVLSSGMVGFVTNIQRLFSIIIHERKDVIHVFTGSSTLLGVTLVVLGKVFGRRTVITFFGREDFYVKNLTNLACLKCSLRLADRILTNSKATLRYVPKLCLKKCNVLMGGADYNPPPTYNELKQKTPSVLFVGRLVRRKGVYDLLDAFPYVLKKIPDARLVIVGDGPERDALHKRATLLSLQSKVEFRGLLYGKELADQYSSASVVVLPSTNIQEDFADEGLGLVLIEAMMFGKPVIGTMHGGIPELVNDGENGILVPENSPEKLADAVITILSNPELASIMGKKGYNVASSKFTWYAATKRLLECYN